MFSSFTWLFSSFHIKSCFLFLFFILSLYVFIIQRKKHLFFFCSDYFFFYSRYFFLWTINSCTTSLFLWTFNTEFWFVFCVFLTLNKMFNEYLKIFYTFRKMNQDITIANKLWRYKFKRSNEKVQINLVIKRNKKIKIVLCFCVSSSRVRESSRERQTDRDRQTETETDRDRQRQTETDRERQRLLKICWKIIFHLMGGIWLLNIL